MEIIWNLKMMELWKINNLFILNAKFNFICDYGMIGVAGMENLISYSYSKPPIRYSHLYFPSAHENVPSPIFQSSTKTGAFSSKLHRVGYGPKKELVTRVYIPQSIVNNSFEPYPCESMYIYTNIYIFIIHIWMYLNKNGACPNPWPSSLRCQLS
jgi:hypothetical protein